GGEGVAGDAGSGTLKVRRLLAIAAASASLLWPGSLALGAPAGPGSWGLTASQLAADLRSGASMSRVPADIRPSLSIARVPVYIGCGQGRAAARSKPCIYGDTESSTSVAVFGDSHAAMWFPALELVAERQHWRLVGLLKSGCPPVEVNIAAWFLGGGQYSACSRWRAEAMAQIAALHPSLVIVTWARWLEEPEARPMPGVPSRYGSAWPDGMAATFSFLRHAARRVTFISDVPTLDASAPLCLMKHRADLQACTPTRSAAVALPTVKAEELQLARQAGVSPIDPTPWFCTETTCPLIVNHILVYHDNSHITPQWAHFIAPVLAGALLSVPGRGLRHS
ncbi:MAG TPA: SGNH hydrolase domain-containing protein, partial [Chloroflexota bacterium]